jgi:hypothetical protein
MSAAIVNPQTPSKKVAAELAKVSMGKEITDVARAIKEEEQDEPLLTESKRRFVLFPIRYHEVSTSRRAHGIHPS